jgi:bacillithiol system protein YtxJ
LKGWQHLTSLAELDKALESSESKKIVLFKHSTRCSISSMAQSRLAKIDTAQYDAHRFYYLDLIAHRDISNAIAERLNEVHQSPQVLVVDHNECILEASHMEISAKEIIDAIV